ncbi:hypothetical protein MMC14_005671 [Varicellaria rhodocarpa]|nr:hypothetical protein [Varicellaria rhodocarpa]
MEMHSELQSAPSSISSMLRNTTETGDIGHFSIKPTQTHMNKRNTPGFLPAEPDLPRHQLDQLYGGSREKKGDQKQIPVGFLPHSNHRAASNPISFHQSENYRPFHHGRRHVSDAESYPSAVLETSSIDQSMSHHRSYADLRSQSPFAYPTRLKRPGYRPSSPALNRTYSRTPYSLDNARGPPGVHGDSNLSVPPLLPLRKFPSSDSMRSSNKAFETILHSSQAPSAKSSSRQDPSSSASETYHQPSYAADWRHPSPQSTTPLYYDYSEGFDEGYEQYPTGMPIGLPREGSMHLPSQGNCDGREGEGEVENLMARELFTSNATSQKFVKTSTPEMSLSRTPITEGMVQTPGRIYEETQFTKNTNTEQHNDLSSSTTNLTNESDVASIGETVGHHILSSSLRGRKNLSLVNPYGNSSNNPMSHKPDVSQPATSYRTERSKTPSLRFGQLNLSEKEEASLEKVPRTNHVPLHAPIAESPRSSEGHEQKFNRILSFDQSYPKLAESAPNSTFCDETVTPSLRREKGKIKPPRGRKPRVPREKGKNRGPELLSRPAPEQSSSPQVTLGLKISGSDGQEVKVLNRTRSHKVYNPSAVIGIDGEPSVMLRKSFDSLSLQRIDEEGSIPRTSVPILSTRELTPDISKQEPARHKSLNSARSKARNRTRSADSPFARYELRMRRESMLLLNQRALPPKTSSDSKQEPVRHKSLNSARSKARNRTRSADSPFGRYELRMRRESMLLLDQRALPPKTSSEWTSRSSENEVSVSQSSNDTAVSHPRFKLKVTRAPNSARGTIQLARQATVPFRSSNGRVGTSLDLFRDRQTRRRSSSSDAQIGRATGMIPIRTRFTEDFEERPSHAPYISLQPPSPDLHLSEVRSFFSDDSSHIQRRGSLRERFSQLKAIAGRMSSSDDHRAADRRQAPSVQERRRKSVQTSVRTRESIVGLSTLQHAKLKVQEKVKGWWQRGEERVRGWGGKVRGR